jgi:hypothetical protein
MGMGKEEWDAGVQAECTMKADDVDSKIRKLSRENFSVGPMLIIGCDTLASNLEYSGLCFLESAINCARLLTQ